MALINSLTSGVSALKSFTRGMEVIGDNIANVNTTAFKASRLNYTDSFSNMLRNSSSSNGNASNTTASQVGTGVKIQTVSANWSQGFVDNTGVETDLAIAGEGFFRVIDPVNNTVYATRAGNFRVDDQGNIVTTNGFRVQGVMGGELQYDVFLDSRNNLVYSIRENFPTDYDGDTIADLNIQPPSLNTTTGSLRLSPNAPSGLTAIPLNSLGTPYPLSELNNALAAATPVAGEGQGLAFGGPFTTIGSIEDAIRVGTITEDQFNRALAAANGGTGLEIPGSSGNYYTSVSTIRTAIDDGTITEAQANAALASVNDFDTTAGIELAITAGHLTAATVDGLISAANGGLGVSIGGNNYTSMTAIRTAITAATITEAQADTALAALDVQSGVVPLFTTLQELRSGLTASVMTEADINIALGASNLLIDGTTFDGGTGTGWADLNARYKINPVTNDTYTIDEINNKAPRVESFAFDVQGHLNITMSDGNSYTRGKLLLMMFSDPQALVKEGDGLYIGFDAAGVVGDFLTNNAGENGVGKILQRSLEQSNVDLTAEFANMITAQRSFQAGSRVVTVSDEILSEVVNLKR